MYILSRVIFTTIILFIQCYYYKKFSKKLKPDNNLNIKKTFLLILFLFFNIPIIYVGITQPKFEFLPYWTRFYFLYPFFIWQGSFVILYLLKVFSKIAKLFVSLPIIGLKRIPSVKNKVEKIKEENDFEKFDQSRRLFLKRGAAAVSGVVVFGNTYGAIVHKEYEINRTIIPIRNLPGDLEHFSISLISDIHSGIFMPKDEIINYVKIINDLGSDIVAIPGDLINSRIDEVYPLSEALSELKARYGVYACMGNHDFIPRSQIIPDEISRSGVRILRNESIQIKIGSSKLFLMGVDDIKYDNQANTEFQKLTSKTENNSTKILLCHRPYFFEQAADNNIDLVLSGHTHGGQLFYAELGDTQLSLASLATKYVWGHYQLNASHMYVSRGLGTVGMPVRINCPPEITKITLVSA